MKIILKILFKSGRFIIKYAKEYGEFLEKYYDITYKIISFFENYYIYIIKNKNSLDFKKVS